MTIPIWSLLAFAFWTLLLLIFTIGITRWNLILTKRAAPNAFRADEIHGSPRYRRAMRAHANCIENLPVYGAIIFVLYVTGIHSILLNSLAILFMIARVCQSVVHVGFIDTNRMVLMRFIFYFIQIIIMFWIGIYILTTV